MKADDEPPYLSTAQVLAFPGVSGLADLSISYAKDFQTACQALEKIATGRIDGQKDTAVTARIMREIALEALKAVRYGDYADAPPSKKEGE